MKAITVNQLLEACKKAKKEGYGKKKILITNDDECNGFHELFYLLTPVEKFGDVDYVNLPYGCTKEKVERDYIILG